MRRRPGQMDYGLLTLVFALLAFGCVMLYSASAIFAEQRYNDPLYFLKRQTLWILLGVPLMLALSRLDYRRLQRLSWPAVGLSALSLVVVLFTHPVAGARRWIRAGPLGFQPAEFAKLALALFLADYLDRRRSKIGTPRGLAAPALVVGLLLGLIALEPDLGTPALLFAASLLVLFVGGARPAHILSALACAAPALVYELAKYPYRRRRLAQFLNPWSDPQGSGYQLVQSLIAVGSGGWAGKGLGSSGIKLMYLPTPHTDFIFPIVAEELGLAGSALLLGLFTALTLRGMRIARAAPNLFGTLLAAGITMTLALQAFFNVAMSVGLLPTKGVPLPFFSFGGSSLLVTLAGAGILLNISRQGVAAS